MVAASCLIREGRALVSATRDRTHLQQRTRACARARAGLNRRPATAAPSSSSAAAARSCRGDCQRTLFVARVTGRSSASCRTCTGEQRRGAAALRTRRAAAREWKGRQLIHAFNPATAWPMGDRSIGLTPLSRSAQRADAPRRRAGARALDACHRCACDALPHTHLQVRWRGRCALAAQAGPVGACAQGRGTR